MTIIVKHPSEILIHHLQPYNVGSYLDWLARTMDSKQPIAIDTETRSVDEPLPWYKGYGRLYQIGTADEAWCMDFQGWRDLISHTQRQVIASRCTVWGANFLHDQRTFYWEGVPTIPYNQVQDTIILHRISDPMDYSHALKTVADKELGSWTTYGQAELHRFMKENGYTWDDIPTDSEPYVFYGGVDTCITVRLGEAIKDRATPWYHIEMGYQAEAFKWENRGMRIDPQAVERAHRKWTASAKGCEQKLDDLGFGDVNWRSGPQVERAFSRMGHVPTKFTAGGKPQYNKTVLKEISIGHGLPAEVATTVMELRRTRSWVSNFGRKLLNFADADGIIHPKIHTMDASTGRSKVVTPSIHTQPHEKVARDIFIPREDDHVLIAVDYDSQEIRIQAGLSGDEKLVKFFSKNGGDYHQYVADLAHIERDVAKTVAYARSYGAGVETIAVNAGVPVDEMEGYLGQIDGAFPSVVAWSNENVDSATKHGYVDLPYGRRTRVNKREAWTKATNAIIQGHGADVLKLAVVDRLAPAGWSDYVSMVMHDEILVSVPKGMADQARHEIPTLLRDDYLPVPLVASASEPLLRWGDNYAEAE